MIAASFISIGDSCVDSKGNLSVSANFLEKVAKKLVSSQHPGKLHRVAPLAKRAPTGPCFPSYEWIAAMANCSRSHVGVAIKRLEAAVLLTWVNRLNRVRETGADVFGRDGVRVRVFHISNGYRFNDLGAAVVLGFPFVRLTLLVR